MRKGGQHKPLILDKFSAEDLETKSRYNPRTKEPVNVFRAGPNAVGSRPARDLQPAARGRAAKQQLIIIKGV